MASLLQTALKQSHAHENKCACAGWKQAWNRLCIQASGAGRVLSLDRSFDNIEIHICQNLLYDNEMSMLQYEQILPQEGRRMLKEH